MSQTPVQSIFRMLMLIGVPPSEIKTNYKPDSETRVGIAIPTLEFALAFKNDKAKSLIDNKWNVQNINEGDIEPFDRIFTALADVEVSASYTSVEQSTTNTSQAEDLLYEALVRKGAHALSKMSRNKVFRDENGSVITKPDFSWEAEKIIVEFDGSWHHGQRDDAALVKAIKETDDPKVLKDLVSKKASKHSKDADKRRKIQEMGWNVIVVMDEGFYGKDANKKADEVADSVIRAIRNKQAEQKFGSMNAEDVAGISELFDESMDDVETTPVDTEPPESESESESESEPPAPTPKAVETDTLVDTKDASSESPEEASDVNEEDHESEFDDDDDDLMEIFNKLEGEE